MALEKDFVIALAESLKRLEPRAVTYRPNDGMTLGVPDLFAWVPNRIVGNIGAGDVYVAGCRPVAVEAKQLLQWLKSPDDPGKHTKPLLHHPFTGPQVSLLRALELAGVEAMGLVRVTSDAAFRISPKDIPADGNFLHADLVRVGRLIRRQPSFGWIFWDRGEP